MSMRKIYFIALLSVIFSSLPVFGWPGMDMPVLHVEGRWLVDENGNKVNLHGFGQTYSPWFNEQGTKWSNYDVDACLKYNKEKLDGVLAAGWKMNWVRMHMDPYWSNTPGVQTTGENDISAFNFSRFTTYLTKVFIPMAEYAISKGLYVVMRPPGVCPEEIAVGDAYHKYLKRVWGYISNQKKLTDNPHIMFELANEPVRIKGTDGQIGAGTDACNRALTQFFQEIVDLMRGNGCKNILWVPGTGYQSQYAGFVDYPIQGENIGYAVHVYPGWYGSDAIEPSHELGGSYGGGFSSFAAGWARQVAPCAEIAPILVTEMDWAPSTYNASWGKSITGKMLGAGFGANFKLLADNTGNVSWMLFTGPELLERFDGVAGSEGKYTLYNDPDACLWPTYHWFKEYAGESLPAAGSVELCFSPRTSDSADEQTVLTGSRAGAALIADSGMGYEMNLTGDFEVEFATPGVMSWDNGFFVANSIGETSCKVSYEYNGKHETREVKFVSTPFPLAEGYFNPSIWETGSFNPSTHEVKTGQYGFAGWKYGAGLDLSDYRYLIAEIEGDNNCGLSFRIYDQDNYWTDPAMANFGNSKKAVLDLNDLRSDNGRKLDPSHIYIAGFWTLGNSSFRLKKVYVSDNPDGESALDIIYVPDSEQPVDVYNLQGMKLKSKVSSAEATEGLQPGIYIVGGKKVIVKR